MRLFLVCCYCRLLQKNVFNSCPYNTRVRQGLSVGSTSQFSRDSKFSCLFNSSWTNNPFLCFLIVITVENIFVRLKYKRCKRYVCRGDDSSVDSVYSINWSIIEEHQQQNILTWDVRTYWHVNFERRKLDDTHFLTV